MPASDFVIRASFVIRISSFWFVPVAPELYATQQVMISHMADPTATRAISNGSRFRLSAILRALHSRNYRLFFSGQIVSLVGTFLTQVATMWLVYRLTLAGPHPERAGLMLGLVGFVGQFPMFLVAPFAGVWVDRLDRRRVLVCTQTIAMLQSFALGVLALTHITIPEVLALSLVQGLVNAFDMPTRQAFVVEMVGNRDDLPNAIALNSTMVHAARLVGPSLAGILISIVGIAWCFLLDGMTYLAVIAALLAMRIERTAETRPKRGVLAEFHEGLRYAWHFVPIRVLLILLAVVSLTTMPAFQVLMPLFGDTFGGTMHGARAMGFLMGASGLGALIGALHLAARTTVLGLGRLVGIAAATFGLALIAFAFSGHLWLSLLIAPIAGFGMITTTAGANTLVQTLVEDEKRGRVMSLFSVAFMGMIPFGNLMSGAAAGHLGAGVLGARRTLMIAGGVCLTAAIVYAIRLPAIRRAARPIYVQRGILPATAAGLQCAAQATPSK
jgi:MFS family permease